MNCPKCHKKISSYNNVCSECGHFLKRGFLKEIILIIRKYQKRQDYKGIYEILMRALEIAAGTKYENKIREQLELAKNQLDNEKQAINALKNKAKNYYSHNYFKKALECYRQMLAFRLSRREQIQIENELLKIKAAIYNNEMKIVNGNGNTLFNIEQ